MKIKSVRHNQSRNPWINFYANYAVKHKENTSKTKQKKMVRGSIMKEAAKRWKSMSEMEKSAYQYAAQSVPYHFKSTWPNLNKFLDFLRGAQQCGADMRTLIQAKNELHKWQNQIFMDLEYSK